MIQQTANTSLVANNIWMMLATMLVFIMHLGFSTLEIGLTRSKNTVNILFKNVIIIAVGLLTYCFIGFNLMYPGDFNLIDGGWLGFSGFGIDAGSDYDQLTYAEGGYTYWIDFLFQGMFAATAATIVSGAVAERFKLGSFIIFSILYVSLVYPIVGSWQWGGGWLSDLGFHDFAGSTLVHSVGGWAALIAVAMVGPRLGKYVDGGIKPIEGHSMPLAAIGVFLLWFGWFGFNGGSVLSADPEKTSFVLVTTSLAAAAGVVGAVITALILFKSFDLTMALNGILAGLVGITAGADVVSISSSIIIGLIAGILIVVAVSFFDRLKLDDPVGALAVHLVCGIWGTLAVGIFGFSAATNEDGHFVNAAGKVVANVSEAANSISFSAQAIGVFAPAVFCMITASLILFSLKMTLGLRVSSREELEGLDIYEHGMSAYPDFATKQD